MTDLKSNIISIKKKIKNKKLAVKNFIYIFYVFEWQYIILLWSITTLHICSCNTLYIISYNFYSYV